MTELERSAEQELSFGAWVRRQRKRLDLTQDALAAEVACATATIRRIEAEERRPSREMALRLAQALEVAPEQHAAFVAWARTGRLARWPAAAAGGLPAAEAPAGSASPPEPLSFLLPSVRLVGRERDLAAVCAELARPEVRLLTVTGAPGIGKTQLGLHAGEALRPRFAHGVAFVDLAAVGEAGLVAATIAQALRLREHGHQSIVETIKAELRGRELLLILDNCEHLPEAAGLFAELLATAPRLKLLATSRAPLRVSLEHEWPLQPLDVPAPGDQTPEQLGGVPAVALFVARAAAAARSFALTADNAPAVGAICRQLDGVPLAIELAAAWSKVLSPQEIAARLGAPFAFLTRRPQDWPARHQTLWEALSWSYELLGAAEQRLLQRLSVFPAAFSLDAAFAACQADGGDQLALLESLAALVDQSLIWRACSAEGESLFGLLDIIRAYGDHHLRAQGEHGLISRRHADYYCALAESAEAALRGDEQARWLARLDAAYPHLRAALRWCLDAGEPELAARIAGALWRFWHLRGIHVEGRMWLEEVARHDASLPDALLARVLNCLGQVLIEQARYDEAAQRFEQGLALQRRLGDQMGVARVLNNLGMIAENLGDFARARRLHEESLALKRPLGDALATANSLNNLGIVLEAQGEYAEARAMLEESLALRRASGDHWSAAVSLLNLAQVAYLQGEHPAALPLLRESVALRRSLGDTTGIAWGFEGIANVAGALGAWREAARLWGAAAALRRALGSPLPPSQRALYDRNIELARARLGDQGFTDAWQAHAGRSHDDLIAEALSLCDRLGAAGE